MKNALLKKNLQLFSFSLMLLFAVGLISLFFVHAYYLDKVTHKHQQNQALLLDERLDKKSKILHAVAISLANSSVIRDALMYEERQPLITELANLREQYAYWTGFVNYAFHAITHDGRSLFRSYAIESYGQNVTDHAMIRQAMREKKAVTRVDKGGYGNVFRVITIQPVMELGSLSEIIGYMTISQGLKQIVSEFKADGVEYYVFEQDATQPLDAEPRRFVIDNGDYFAKRQFSDWVFQSSEIKDGVLMQRDGWYYQTKSILDEQGQLRAFHLIAVPEGMLRDQAWSLMMQIAWIFLALFSVVVLMGLVQIGLLRVSVLKPMRNMTATINNIIKTERYDQAVEVLREDEIGQMSRYFNQLLQKTYNLIFNLKYLELAINKTLIMSRADKFGNIIDVNDNFCQISGYSAEELIGGPHSIVRHPDMPKSVFKDLWQTIQSKEIWRGEIKNLRKDGSNYYVMSYIIPILDQNNELIEYLSIRQDITLIVELRESLQKALNEAQHDKQVAQQANKAKSEFLSSMSHELRTPLNAIIGFSQLLEISPLTETQKTKVETIKSSGLHLLQLINGILEFAKFESGKITINLQPIKIKNVIKEAMALVESNLMERGIQLDIEALTSEEEVIADRLRVKQVVLNLISNAIKYNKPNGFIKLTCRLSHRGGKTYWELSVKDSGVGIAAEHLEQLFEPFNRLGHESSSIEGSGIGLTITKELVEQMQGYIEVSSELGVGTEFIVGLPLNKALMPTEQAETMTEFVALPVVETPIVAVNQRLRVLYIEDNSANMQLMSDIFDEMEGVELKIAPSAENGFDQAKRWLPHVVFMDINLPGMNGDEALAYFKSLNDLQALKTQFYAMSANAEDSQIEHSKRLGFDGYITKPFDIKTIQELISALQGQFAANPK